MFYSNFPLVLLAILFISIEKSTSQNCTPYGVHQSLGDYFQLYINENDPTLIDKNASKVLLRVSFLTPDQCNTSYIIINFNKILNLTSQTFFNGTTYNASSNFSIWLHNFNITTDLNIEITSDLYYTIYTNNTTSAIQKTFRLRIPDRDSGTHNIIITGNMDISSFSNDTLTALQTLTKEPLSNIISAFIYTGNMAYNLESNDYAKGLNFLDKIQAFAAFWPTMPTAGFFENYNNFTFFNFLFSTINKQLFNNFFYSFNLGKAHFVQMNMVYLFDPRTTLNARIWLENWLKEDLTNANISSNRKSRPWIIIYGHSSFYCSYPIAFCGNHIFNNGSNETDPTKATFERLEIIFRNFLVDLYISSTQANIYERLPPLSFQTKGSYSSLISPDVNSLYIVNPNKPVFLIESNGGNINSSSNKYDEKLGFTLVQSKNPGYGLLTIINGTALRYKHIPSNSSNTDTDTFYLINTKTKWEMIWEPNDKFTFIIAFVFFVVVGATILIVFMMYIE